MTDPQNRPQDEHDGRDARGEREESDASEETPREGAEVIDFLERRERSQTVKLREELKRGAYAPDMEELADRLVELEELLDLFE